MPMRIAYYITPHGFGHAIRSLEVMRHLMEAEPELEIFLVSDIPDFLVKQNLERLPVVRKKRLDAGLVQVDSLRFDLEATLHALTDIHRRERELVSKEVDFLDREKIQGLVADIPFLPFRAAAEVGIPSVGLGNFTWDWIYNAYGAADSRWHPIVAWIRENYRMCDLFLQLPMHGDCSACTTIRDVPLVARKALLTVEEARRILACDPDKRYYLISFSDLQLDEGALRRLEAIENTVFLYRHPLRFRLRNGRSLDDCNLSYADIVAAVDGVITKPGYGIVADCIACGTPVIYTDRGFFPEYEILAREIDRHLRSSYLPSMDLYAGCWESAIRNIESLPDLHVPVRADGASVCADLILERLSSK
jgi:hypothetical protein